MTTAEALCEEDASPRWDELKGSDAAPYSRLFTRECDRQCVWKQVCDAWGIDRTDDEESDFPVCMHGPKFYQLDKSGRVIGVLAIGLVGNFQVEFENKRVRKCFFVECWTGKQKSFETFGECFKFVMEETMKMIHEVRASNSQPSSENSPRDRTVPKARPNRRSAILRQLRTKPIDSRNSCSRPLGSRRSRTQTASGSRAGLPVRHGPRGCQLWR